MQLPQAHWGSERSRPRKDQIDDDDDEDEEEEDDDDEEEEEDDDEEEELPMVSVWLKGFEDDSGAFFFTFMFSPDHTDFQFG